MPTSRSYHTYLIESLRDPEEAAAYLDAILEDCTVEELRLALTQVAEAQVATIPELDSIYQSLVQQQHFDFPTLLTMLSKLGFRLSVAPKEKAA